MKKIKFGISAVIMLVTMIISDRKDVLLIYAFSAFLHEMGHLTAAKFLKIHIEKIQFDFSGVRICIEDKLTSYRSELLLSLAGPLVNFLIILSLGVYFVLNGIGFAQVVEDTRLFLIDGQRLFNGVLGFMGISSAVQGGINLMPIKTFDGGRVLYCLLADRYNEDIGDKMLSLCSALAAFVIWTVSLYLMIKISTGLGIYVFAACVFASTLKDTEF